MSSKNIIYSSVFLGPFTKLVDPRRSNATLYNFHEILVIALCACIAGADNFVAMERFGKAKIAFFEEHLDLANGIPSHDTFGDLFALLDPVEFNKCFMNWIANKTRENDLKFIAIDGKALRGSHYKSHSKKMIHTVNAWATEQQCFLGQCCTDVKSNEITAIPKLLKMMWIEGAIITIDAMGTQKRIASQIIQQKGDYILCLKENHPTFHKKLKELFNSPSLLKSMKESGVEIDLAKTEEKSRGREEIRHCVVVENIDWYDESDEWEGLRSVVMIERHRTENEKISVEHHYYISSLAADAGTILAAVRSHWGIENSLHWVLDVSWNEDQSRIRMGNAAQNVSLLRKISINILNESPKKDSLKGKQQQAGWNNKYLAELLNF